MGGLNRANQLPNHSLCPYSEKDITIVFETISTGSIPVGDAKAVRFHLKWVYTPEPTGVYHEQRSRH